MQKRKQSKIKILINRIKAHLSAFKYWGNYKFCKKYPFMKARNVWTGEFAGYEFTMLDELPEGWRKAFGQAMVDELKEAIAKDGCDLHWEQIKEKFGQLRLYASCGKNAQEVLNKYEVMSYGYCIECGKPVKYITSGYISYLCEDCFNAEVKHVKLNDQELKQYIKQHRLTKNDIPYAIFYDSTNDKKITIDYKDKYGIDFYQLWDLKKPKKAVKK